MNAVNLIGKIVEGPVRRGPKVKFSILCSRKYADDGAVVRKSSDIINCVAFGKTADAIERDVKNGERWLANGRWAVSRYQDEQGNWNTTNEMVVTMMAKPLDLTDFS